MPLDYSSGYCSPILRKAIWDLLNPGSVVEYEVLTMTEAFPSGHQESRARPCGAVRCTIIRPDGSYVVGIKEIDTLEQRKDKKWYPIEQTPENFTADCTKALGRALRDGGIPQKKGELTALMNLIAAMRGQAPRSRPVDASTIEGSAEPDEVDSPDAGGSDDLTEEQQVAVAVGSMDGPSKALLARWAREELGVANLMRSGEHAPRLAEAIRNIENGLLPDGQEEEF